MSHFQITDSHSLETNFSTDKFRESNQFAACVPDLIYQSGEKVMDCRTQVKYISPIQKAPASGK